MSKDEQPIRGPVRPPPADDELCHVEAVGECVVALYDELHGSVFRYLLCLGVTPDCADDTIQEAFLRLCTHLDRGGRAQNLRAWVFRVAHNFALSERRNSRHVTLPGPAEWQSVLDTSIDRGQSPEALLLERERMSAVQRAMRTLSPHEDRCVHLRMEGLRYREIAEVLGITISSVSEYLSRALVKLRRPPDA